MNKKIIAVAVLLLVLVVAFAACKKDTEYKVDYTVTLENGEVVEVYEDENGENFVTNVDGDKIPVTSDADGFYDSIADLITETTKNADKNTSSSKPVDDKGGVKDESSSSDKEPASSGNKNESSSNKEETSSEASSVQIGSDKNQDAVIDWNDIVAVP